MWPRRAKSRYRRGSGEAGRGADAAAACTESSSLLASFRSYLTATSAPGLTGLTPAASAPRLRSPRQHLHRDLRSPRPHFTGTGAHARHTCTGTGLAAAHICIGTGLTPATSVPERLCVRALRLRACARSFARGSVCFAGGWVGEWAYMRAYVISIPALRSSASAAGDSEIGAPSLTHGSMSDRKLQATKEGKMHTIPRGIPFGRTGGDRLGVVRSLSER